MNNQFEIIVSQNPKLSLEAIGVLALLCTYNNFQFETRESFLEYFHLPSHIASEKIFSELINFKILTREQVQDKQHYHLKRTKVRLVVPMKYNESKSIQKLIEEKLEKFKSVSVKQAIEEALAGLKENIEKNSIMNKYDVEKYFSFFEDLPSEKILEFLSIYKSKELYGKVNFKYCEAVVKNLKVVKKQSVSDSLVWDDDKQKQMELEFAKKIASGEVSKSLKYQSLLKRKEYGILKSYYEIGKKFIEKPYTDYEWLENEGEINELVS